MTSQYATTWVNNDLETPHFLRTDREGVPLQRQVPLSIDVITATGAVPTPCPDVVVISGAAAITLTATSLADLVGRQVTFCSDAQNAVQHIITLPANCIGGAQRTATFAANAGASITFVFFAAGGAFYADVVSLRNVTLS